MQVARICQVHENEEGGHERAERRGLKWFQPRVHVADHVLVLQRLKIVHLAEHAPEPLTVVTHCAYLYCVRTEVYAIHDMPTLVD